MSARPAAVPVGAGAVPAATSTRVLFAGGGTGGHLYPALALAAAVQAERPGTGVHFAGAQRGVEARVLPAQGVPHTLLPFQPLYRDRVWRNWKVPFALAASLRGLAQLFRRFRPQLVVGTGGYAAGPACFYAVLRGTPMALQEQNSFPGMTIRLLSRWARQVHLGFPEARRYLKPGRHTQVFDLGNPIRPPDFSLDRTACRVGFGLPAEGMVVLVVGGSQGARGVNRALAEALERVAGGALEPPPATLQILWATGPTHIDTITRQLAPLYLDWVHARGYIDDMPRALAAADVALSRAGAMATAELLAWGIPAVLVPFPAAAANHQDHNARALAEAGAALYLPETELTPARLWRDLLALTADRERRARMRAAALERARPHAARDIAQRLLELVP